MVEIRRYMSSGLWPRSNATCGSPHRGRVSLARAVPGPRPSGSLRLLKFDPVEFVFARAKTILPGAKLGAHSAPAGPAPRMARVKETKESTPRMAQRLPRLRGFGSRAAPTRHPVAAGQAQTSLSAPLRALAQSLTGLGRAIRVLKTPPSEGLRWVAPVPVGASRAPSEAGCFRETFDRARGALFALGELGERTAEARRAGDRAYFARRSDRVSFSLVPFSWTSKRKEPRVQGRSHPQLVFECPRSGLDRN
jgi:hypothetical protein